MPPDVSFERGPDFFDGVEVRGVSRQEQGGDAVFPESLLDGPCLVKAGIVKNQGCDQRILPARDHIRVRSTRFQIQLGK